MMILALSLLSMTALANDDEAKIVYKQKTEIDFEAMQIEGELVKPQGTIILERKKASFNPLIKLRSNFTHEMSRSVKEIE